MSLCHPLAFRKPPSFHFGLLSTALSLTVSTIFSIFPRERRQPSLLFVILQSLPRAMVLWVHRPLEWGSTSPQSCGLWNSVSSGVGWHPFIWYTPVQLEGYSMSILDYFPRPGLMKGARTSNASNWDKVKMMWQSEKRSDFPRRPNRSKCQLCYKLAFGLE